MKAVYYKYDLANISVVASEAEAARLVKVFRNMSDGQYETDDLDNIINTTDWSSFSVSAMIVVLQKIAAQVDCIFWLGEISQKELIRTHRAIAKVIKTRMEY